MKKTYCLLALFLLLNSCSWLDLEQSPRSRHEDYLQKIKDQKSKLSYKDYQFYLKTELDNKKMELIQLKSMQEESRKRMSYNQASSNTHEIGDIGSFKVQSGQMEERKLQEKMNYVNRQILFLQSQID